MMNGTITNLRPHLNLLIKGEGSQGVFEFTVDTGYEGTFTLSAADSAALQLPWLRKQRSFLADGSSRQLDVYRLAVVWDGEERNAEILAVGQEPLVGATMLQGYELCLNYATNTLTIKTA